MIAQQKQQFMKVYTKMSEGVKEMKDFLVYYKEVAKQVKTLYQREDTKPIAMNLAKGLKKMREKMDVMATKMSEVMDVYK